MSSLAILILTKNEEENIVDVVVNAKNAPRSPGHRLWEYR